MDPTDNLLQQVAAGFVRHALTTAGGALVAHGLLQASCAQTAIGCIDVGQFVGAGMVLVGMAWSYYHKTGEAQIKATLAKMAGDNPPIKMDP